MFNFIFELGNYSKRLKVKMNFLQDLCIIYYFIPTLEGVKWLFYSCREIQTMQHKASFPNLFGGLLGRFKNIIKDPPKRKNPIILRFSLKPRTSCDMHANLQGSTFMKTCHREISEQTILWRNEDFLWATSEAIGNIDSLDVCL